MVFRKERKKKVSTTKRSCLICCLKKNKFLTTASLKLRKMRFATSVASVVIVVVFVVGRGNLSEICFLDAFKFQASSSNSHAKPEAALPRPGRRSE